MSESNAFADETAAAWRDEVQSQRDGDAHLIVDPRPTRAELEADNFDDWAWARRQANPIVWRCIQCNQGHYAGAPEDGCRACGWVWGEVQP